MTETNEKEKSEPNNPALFKVEAFNKAVASRDKLITSHETTISALEEQIGNQQITISKLMEENKSEKSARSSAETELAEKKNLKVEHKGNYYKSQEERFADEYKEACRKLRGE